MAVDLFSMILSPVISWGVNRLLDTVVNCSYCGHETVQDISNYAINDQYCSNCNNQLDQYVNASHHTVNRNKSVVGAYVSNLHWPGWKNKFKLYYDLDVINSKYEPVVVKLILSKFNGPIFHEYEFIKRPTFEITRWTNSWIEIPGSNFPEEPQIIAVDIEVYNTWGDFLCEKRDLMEYGMGADNDCFLTTLTCGLNGLSDSNHVLNSIRQFRDNYLIKLLDDYNNFISVYKSLSYKIICDSKKNYKTILPKYYDSHLIHIANKINNQKFNETGILLADMLSNLKKEYQGMIDYKDFNYLINILIQIRSSR